MVIYTGSKILLLNECASAVSLIVLSQSLHCKSFCLGVIGQGFDHQGCAYFGNYLEKILRKVNLALFFKAVVSSFFILKKNPLASALILSLKQSSLKQCIPFKCFCVVATFLPIQFAASILLSCESFMITTFVLQLETMNKSRKNCFKTPAPKTNSAQIFRSEGWVGESNISHAK